MIISGFVLSFLPTFFYTSHYHTIASHPHFFIPETTFCAKGFSLLVAATLLPTAASSQRRSLLVAATLLPTAAPFLSLQLCSHRISFLSTISVTTNMNTRTQSSIRGTASIIPMANDSPDIIPMHTAPFFRMCPLPLYLLLDLAKWLCKFIFGL
jgi:hypothetical protein